MSTILGLMTTEQLASSRFTNIRREVFLMYPNGTAPLIGILSLLKEEVTNDPSFSWFEKRLQEQSSTLANISTTVVVYSSVSADFATWTAASSNPTFAADGTQYGIKVTSAANFRASHLIRFYLLNASSVSEEFIARVTYADQSNNRLAITFVKVSGNATDYDAANAGAVVQVIGNAHAEGALSNSSTGTSTMNSYKTPVNPGNYTQIFRTPYQITRTMLKTSVKYDENGVYPDQAKDASTNHMREMEWSYLYGTKTQSVSSDNQTVVRTTGGILYWLTLWEAGSTYGNTAASSDTDDNKRIITNTAGTIGRVQYEGYLERVFRHIRSQSNELLCLCGSGALLTMQNMYEGRAGLNSNLPMESTFGMNVTAHQTIQGKVYYKTHPLFNLNATLRYNMLFVDVSLLKYRYLNGSDTELLKDRAPNNADYIENEYLTEAGLEVQSPESHLYLQNVTTYQP